MRAQLTAAVRKRRTTRTQVTVARVVKHPMILQRLEPGAVRAIVLVPALVLQAAGRVLASVGCLQAEPDPRQAERAERAARSRTRQALRALTMVITLWAGPAA
jgi:hypothetical protein